MVSSVVSGQELGQVGVMCPGCGGKETRVFWSTQGVPVHCNSLCRSREQALAVPKGDISLAYCRQCGLISNVRFDEKLMAYDPDYENSLHFSGRFQKYAEALAQRLIDQHDLRDKDIVEIACGRGDFLEMLCTGGGNRGIGFDPSVPDDVLTGRDATADDSPGRAGEIRFVKAFYGARGADYPVDFICCRHALEHVPDPVGFLKTLRANIGDRLDTLVFFEVPNVLYTLRELGIWDVIYEHCLYFSRVSLARVFAHAGFEVLAVNDEYEGQFLSIEAKPAATGAAMPVESPEDLTALSRDVHAFGQKYREKIGIWEERLTDLASSGRRAVVWGSGSKGVTFLNTIHVGSLIDYVVDINPRKQGMFVPGGGQQIVGPDELQRVQPEVVIVMNPIYQAEIASMLASVGLSPEVVLA